jgi:hypothetical protein
VAPSYLHQFSPCSALSACSEMTSQPSSIPAEHQNFHFIRTPECLQHFINLYFSIQHLILPATSNCTTLHQAIKMGCLPSRTHNSSSATEKVTEPSDHGNTNCTNCTKCHSCTNCKGTSPLLQRAEYVSKIGVLIMMGRVDCTSCHSCKNCTSCTECHSCNDCEGCVKCYSSMFYPSLTLLDLLLSFLLLRSRMLM